MADENKPNNDVDAQGIDTRWTGSQAEGDRDTVNEDLQEKYGSQKPRQKPGATGGDPLSTPSQAEGDRETIERDLDEKQ